MAVSRGGVAFCVSCVCRLGRRFPIRGQSSNLSQVIDCQWFCQNRPLSSASWALAPPNSLKYQSIKRPALSHPSQHASQPQSGAGGEGGPGSFSLCVLVRQGEVEGLHTLVEVPLPDPSRVGQFLTLDPYRSSELAFLLTTVDGSREDDISVGGSRSRSREAAQRQHGCFRSLFEAEGCPAPFADGSRFYCFHCPGSEPATGHKSRHDGGLDKEPVGQVGGGTSLCSHAQGVEGGHHEGDPEREEKLALMYERLRTELPGFFTSHDFTMYSRDMEFINGLMNTRSRGRLLYQLTLSLCRLLCLCCCVEARLEVLKLTKHTEDGTIKARWRIRGLPVHSLLLRFYQKDKSHLYRSYDAFSTFYIGQDGLIHCHKVEKVMPAQPPILPRITSLMAGALVALGVQEHRPALNLLPLLLSSLRQIRN